MYYFHSTLASWNGAIDVFLKLGVYSKVGTKIKWPKANGKAIEMIFNFLMTK